MQRRVSVRKGSTTAPDPHGLHSEINLNPFRSSLSTLTIVRTSPTPLPDIRSASPQRRIHRRSPPSDTTNRLSFAFSSFASNNSANKEQPPSPSSSPRLPPSSPRLRPSSPHHGRSGSLSSSKPRLTPDQIVDLARQAVNPKSLDSGSPTGIPHSITPATFTPLPDDIYLPFIDRPSEVAALISSPPDLKLFSLLAQTFPNNKSHIDPSIQLPSNPIQWSYSHLIHHLTHIDRDIVPDYIWAIAARKCIHAHSELIWERVKGALGIPPELDIDCDFSQQHQPTLNPDEGLVRGHWEDWDSAMDSPIERSFESHLADKDGHDAPEHDIHAQPTSGAASPTLDRRYPFSPPPTITHQQATLDTVSPDYLSIEPLLAVPLSSASNSFNSLSNHHLPDGLGDIAEGAEEDETELVSNIEPAAAAPGSAPVPERGAQDSDLIPPSQIQGLKISTSPIPSFGTPPMMSPISPLPPYPPAGMTVGPPPNPSGFSSSLPRSRGSSVSSIGPFQRSESTGSLAALRNAAAAAGVNYYASSVFTGSEAGDTRERDSGYMSDGDRPPGQPLFPSNFARLAMGRTK